jgi:hypothetical protein
MKNLRYTHNAQIVVDWLESQNNMTWEPYSPIALSSWMHESGIRIIFAKNSKEIYMSIQTSIGLAFAESAIGKNSKLGNRFNILYPMSLGYYGDVLHHGTPNELFVHIKDVAKALDDNNFFDDVYNKDEDEHVTTYEDEHVTTYEDEHVTTYEDEDGDVVEDVDVATRINKLMALHKRKRYMLDEYMQKLKR